MDLTHSFTVPAPLEETWRAFLDIEDVAGCFPGAEVTSVEGDDFKGTCKVKLGPIALVYAGSGTFVERDEAGHRFVVEAKGKDKRGNGTAGATVTAVLSDAGGDSTNVEVQTNLSITGKPAQFGRGVIQDVSDKLLQQFVGCLESKVGAGPEVVGAPGEADAGAAEAAAAAGVGAGAPAAAGGDHDGEAATGAPVGTARKVSPGEADESGAGAGVTAGVTGAEVGMQAGAGAGAAGARDASAAPRHAGSRPSQNVEALDLGATLVPVLLKSYWKPLVGALAALLALSRLRRRRRRR